MNKSIVERFEALKRELEKLVPLIYKRAKLDTVDDIHSWKIFQHNFNVLDRESGKFKLLFRLEHKPDFSYRVGGKEYPSIKNGCILCLIPFASLRRFLEITRVPTPKTFVEVITDISVGSELYPISDLAKYSEDAKYFDCELNRMSMAILQFNFYTKNE